MRWIKYTIDTTTEAEEMVCAILGELDIFNVEIDNFVPVPDGDKQGGDYKELLPNLPEDDGSSKVSFYLEEDVDADAILASLSAELKEASTYMNIGSGAITKEVSDEADWRDNWKEFFSSFSIGNIFIKPTWEEAEKDSEDQILIEIDPGVSFGTGKHESTHLVIEQLPTYLQPGQKVLDVGCGSGILSIVALKMGAAHVVGTDIDQDCIDSTYENFEVNHLEAALGDFYVGNLIDDESLQETVGKEGYELVLANILADIIIPMAPALAEAMKPGAHLITSGIIDFKEDEVRSALEAAGLTVVDIKALGEWRSITCSKSL